MAPYDQSERLAAALRSVRGDVTLDRVEGAEHFFGGCSDAEVEALFERAMGFARRCTDARRTV
jgi:hypothetical protein